MMCNAPRSLVLAALWCGLVSGQTPPAKLAFEVVSVKPGPARNLMELMRSGRLQQSIDDAQVALGSISLLNLLEMAYDVPSSRISGPGWLNDTRFDVMAKLPAGASKSQVPEMLQSMLAERFHLAVHIDQKVMPVYGLEVGKATLKIQESANDDSAPSCNGSLRTRMKCHKQSMEDLANLLNPRGLVGQIGGLDRPVIDVTGIKGLYDFTLGFGLVPDGGRRGGAQPAGDLAAADPTTEVTWAEAVKLLGFKLEPTKHTFDYLVIDHVDRTPTEN
jgi:uncharacterized protein (TIGR03435 family)